MKRNLFVYGSLLNNEVVQAHVGKVFKKEPCSLENYFVSKLADREAPGMVKKDGSVAVGVVLKDVDKRSYQIIKKWEGDDYKEIPVSIQPLKGAQCSAFLWKGETLDEPWNNLAFRAEALDWYVRVDIPNYLSSR